jgi:hypothetical protein
MMREAHELSRLSMVVESMAGVKNRGGIGVGREPESCRGKSRAHTTQKMERGCNCIHLAASLCGNWDTRRRILKTKGISVKLENVSVEGNGGLTGGCRS